MSISTVVDLGAGGSEPTRDPLKYPGAAGSPYNLGVGSGAVFESAKFFAPPNGFFGDQNPIVATPTAALVAVEDNWVFNGFSGPYWEVTTTEGGGVQFEVPVGTNTVAQTENNLSGGIVLADGVTVQEFQQYTCPSSGGPVKAYGAFGQFNVKGLGIPSAMVDGPWNQINSGGTRVQIGTGGHGGSGLSGFMGSIRVGELTTGANNPNGPPHALTLTCDLNSYGYKGVNAPGGTTSSEWWQWPAVKADNDGTYGTINPPAGGVATGTYDGRFWAVGTGTMLAVPSSAYATLVASLTTVPGRKMAWTLLNYGCFIVDNSYGTDTFSREGWGIACDAWAEFEAFYGYSFDAEPGNTAWHADQLACFLALQVIVNSSLSTPGGGGTYLQPAPPPFA